MTYEELLAAYAPLQRDYNAKALDRFNAYSNTAEPDPSIKRPVREDTVNNWQHADPNLKKFDFNGKSYNVVYEGGKPVAITNMVGDDYTMRYDAANPNGVRFERQSDFNFYRDALENFAVQAGNVYLPGSGVITGKLTSKGSQEMLNSPTGKFGLLVGGATGAATGNLSNYGFDSANPDSGLLAENSFDTGAMANSVGYQAPPFTPSLPYDIPAEFNNPIGVKAYGEAPAMDFNLTTPEALHATGDPIAKSAFDKVAGINPLDNTWDKVKDAKRLIDAGKSLMGKDQGGQGMSGGLLDAGGMRQFSPLEVNYLPKLQSYGLLNQPQSGLLGF